MEQDEQFDLLCRVESLYWELFMPFIEAVDKSYGKPEGKTDPALSIVRNLLARKDEEILETPTYRGYLDDAEKQAISLVLKSYQENSKDLIYKICQNAGVEVDSENWLKHRLKTASLELAEEIHNNRAGNLDSLRKIRWGIRLGLDLIPDEKYQKTIYKVIEELEGQDGERIRKTIEYFNQRE